jgi:membrane protein YqaA with SNARE-associated domain
MLLMSKEKKRVNLNPYKVGAMIVLMIIVILFLYSIFNYKFLEEKISEEIKIYGIVGIGFFAFLLDLVPQYISPHVLAVIGNLLDMNMFYVILFMVIGSILGSMTAFEIGSKLKKSKFLIEFMGKKREMKIKKGINQGGKYIISLAAISPLPYIPVVIGMLHMERKKFILYGVVPRITGLIVVGLLTYGIFL